MEHAYISEGKKTAFWRGPILSLLFMAAFALITVSLASLFLLRAENPSAWIRTLGVLLPALTSFFGGIVSARAKGGMGALSGLISGALLVIILALSAHLLGDSTRSFGARTVLYTFLLLISVLGGMLGAQKKGKRRHKRRK